LKTFSIFVERFTYEKGGERERERERERGGE